MKHTKKLFAVLLVLAMVLALAAPVGATDAAATGSITIVPKDNGEHTFTAYQIFQGTLSASGVLSDVEWATGVDGTAILTALKADTTIGSYFNDCTTAANVAEALSEKNIADDSDAAKALASVLKTAVSSTTGTKLTKNETTGKYTATNLPVGYYLVVDSTTETTGVKASDLILKVVGNIEVEAKSDIPEVTKTADADSYGIGDTVSYTLTATVPDYSDDVTDYKLEFTDTMAASLDLNYTYIANSSEPTSGITVTMYSSDTDTVGTDVTGNFTIRYNTTTHELTVKCADISKISNVSSASTFVVTYSATINDTYKDGDVSNKVTLITKDYESPEIVEKVFPVTLEVKKVDGEDNTALAGAEFILSRTVTDDNGNTATEYLQVSSGKANTWTTDINQASALTTDADGEINISGLAGGAYSLTETKAPTGYNLPSGAFTLVITAEKNEAGDALETLNITVNNGQPQAGTDGTVTATIANNKGATLPSTGGRGTTIFYIVGAVLVLGAVVLLVTKKRMSAEK